MRITGFSHHNVAIRLREGEKPALFMQDAVVTVDGSRQNTDSFSSKSEQVSLSIFGNIEEGMALQDGDTLLMQVKNNPLQESVEVIIENKDGVYLSTGVSFTPSAIAAQMEEHLCVCIADTRHKNVMSTAIQIYSKAIELYEEFPAFRNIMVKDQEGCTQEKSLLALVITQDEDFVKWAETMILSMDSKYKTLFPVAKQVLEHSTSNTGFTLLSKEEQVAAFLEFSKRHADKAVEIVPDRLIKYLKNSLEYAETVSKLKQAGLGESETQQFNVLQQIGYFGGFISDIKKGNVIYNLSDMGADKRQEYKTEISDVARDIETLQHRKFNIDDVSMENRHVPTIKKKSVVEESYFMKYGSKILVPRGYANSMSVQNVLSEQMYNIEVEPEESDNVSFELFYRIAATSAITAQSLQVAEELFGEQATQHKSSIIKTMSPFTDEEILLLDTLHKIAADANKYRSANIGRDINNAILNLNDGLQQKDLYTLIAGFAERNTKFLEYLAGLDVNILERLPKTGLIRSSKLTDTHKFHVLKELLEKDKDETFLIVVNDYYAMKALADALGVSCLTKQELKDEMAYQELLDGLFEKQNIVIVTQDMIKSSLDLVQANRLVQYQLNTEVSDIIQTQNRINRIGQTRETRCYYIAADRLQNALIELFLDSYRNIRVAHKGIVELFADLSSQIDVINDYLDVAFKKLGEGTNEEEGMVQDTVPDNRSDNDTDLVNTVTIPRGYRIQSTDDVCNAVLFPEKDGIGVIVPLRNGNPFRLGLLKPGIIEPVTSPTRAMWNVKEMKLIR